MNALSCKEKNDPLDSGDDVDAEEAWLNEAERRYQEYRAGKLASRSADAVFEDALSNLK